MSRLPKSHRHPTPRTLHFLLTTKNLINFYAIFTIIFPFSRFTLSLVPPCSINNKKCFFIPENSYSIMSFCHVRSCEERREANMCECHWAGSMIWLGVMFRGYAWHFSRCSMFFFFRDVAWMYEKVALEVISKYIWNETKREWLSNLWWLHSSASSSF